MLDAGFRNFKCLNRGGLQRRGCREVAKPRIEKDEFAQWKNLEIFNVWYQHLNFGFEYGDLNFQSMKFPLSISHIFKWRRLDPWFPYPFSNFASGMTVFWKIAHWCGDRPRGGRNGVIPLLDNAVLKDRHQTHKYQLAPPSASFYIYIYIYKYMYIFYEWESVHTILLTTTSTIMIENNSLFVGAL